MVDMKFNLDLIWIDKNKVIGITPNVPMPPPCNQTTQLCNSKLPLYYPPSVVDSVLEVNEGWAKKFNINVGDNLVVK